MLQIEKVADIINDLIQINNDRIEGYNKAVNETKDIDADLRMTFNSMIAQSSQFKQELSALVNRFGEEPEDGTRTDGKIYRAWMDVKALFSGNSRKSVLENCEFGEDAALKAYKTALSTDNDLPVDVRTLLQQQEVALKASHDLIRTMRDATK